MRIEITGMTYGANAVGRAEDGKVMFVAGGAPGDVVEAEVTHEAKAFREGKITSFLEPPTHRTGMPVLRRMRRLPLDAFELSRPT